MIWQDTTPPETARNQMAGKLLEDVPALCGNPALAADPSLTEAAQGVAHYLDRIEVMPETMDLHRSRDLLAQALDAAGEAGLARRIRLFGNRIIVPASWIACGEETVWVLDTRPLVSSRDAGMEIILFDRIRVVLETFSDVWDAASGRGVLALKGLAATTAALFPGLSMAGRRDRLSLRHEIRDLCVRHFDGARTVRHWGTVPVVLTLHS